MVDVVQTAVLIPVKSFRFAKRRLADWLPVDERERLARWMAARVLRAAAPLPVWVACDDERVAEWAESLHAHVSWGPGLGLNGAIDHGIDILGGKGVEHVVVTHPEFTCQRFTIEDQVALADRGCLIERCLSTPHSGKTSFEHVFDGVRAVGLERNFFSSDLGNPDYPAVEDGLALWADRLLGAGFGEDETREMIVAGSRRVAGER